MTTSLTDALGPRSPDHVPIVNASPFVAFTVAWAVRPPRRSLTLVVKATYRFTEGDNGEPSLVLANEPRLPQGDVRLDDDDLGSALLYASDFAPFKPKADVTLSGFGYTTAPEHTAGLVELEVGPAADRIAVFGPRRWDAAGGQTAPARAERVPLTHAFAYGGPGEDRNPVGLGREGRALPQLEDPDRLLTSPSDTREPACPAPVAPTWAARSAHLGTYGGSWVAERWPFYPDDFDWAHFNAAPAKLQVPYLRGDERVRVSGCRPDGRVLQARLPGRVPRLVALHEDGTRSEVTAHPDTVHVDAEAGEVIVLWRGVFEVSGPFAPELRALGVVDVALDEPLSPEGLEDRLLAAIASAADEPDDPSAIEELPPVPVVERSAIERALAQGDDLAGVAWPGADLSKLSLVGRDLTGAMLSGCNLSGADLSGTRLVEAQLDGANLEGARLSDADLTGANLRGAHGRHAHLERATLTEAVLAEAHFSASSFVGATAKGAIFAGCVLDDATLAGAVLSEADLSGASLRYAKLEDATLDDARLYDAQGKGAVFDRARGADLRADGALLSEASFIGCAMPGASFEGARLTRTRWRTGNFDGANFAHAEATGADFGGCRLRRSVWRGARAAGAVLEGSDLMQADLAHGDFRRGDLRGANLYQAETWEADLDEAQLEGAHVAGTKLEER